MSYELKSARYLAHDILSCAVLPGDTVLDATMGNGHDTLFLCGLVGKDGHVFAFDIQEQAVKNTRRLLAENEVLDRATLFCTGHEHLAEYVESGLSAGVFNLGWLPGGDKAVTTHWETTFTAVSAALTLLKKNGVLIICAYPGHAEGDRERGMLTSFLASLKPQEYNVLHQRFINAGPGAPECFVIQKQ